MIIILAGFVKIHFISQFDVAKIVFNGSFTLIQINFHNVYCASLRKSTSSFVSFEQQMLDRFGSRL